MDIFYYCHDLQYYTIPCTEVVRVLPKKTFNQCPKCIRNKVSPSGETQQNGANIYDVHTECAPVN